MHENNNTSERKRISFFKVTQLFPNYTWVLRDHELCGFNRINHKWIVIDDGACLSEDGTWCVHTYQLEDDEEPITNNYKYCGFEKKIGEKRYQLA